MRRVTKTTKKLSYIILTLWFMGLSMVLTSLAAKHLVALPVPPANPEMVSAFEALRPPKERGQWIIVHVLYGPCPCAARLVDHLIKRPTPSDLSEHVLLINDQELRIKPALASSGRFTIHELPPEALETRFHLQSSPLMVLLSPSGELRYLGGYTTHKQGPAPQDMQILDRARAQDAPISALPVLGCAVARQLQELINPLGI